MVLTFVVLISVSVLCTGFLITTHAAAAAPVVTVLAGVPIAVSASDTTPTGPNPNPPVPHVAGAAVVPYSHHVLLAITHVVRDSGFFRDFFRLPSPVPQIFQGSLFLHFVLTFDLI